MNWKDLQERCYTPYSERNQVSVVLGESGTLYPGVRLENISFPLSIDAVQAALFSCLSEGDTPWEVILPDDPCSDFLAGTELRFWEDIFGIACVRHAQPSGDHPPRFFQTGEDPPGVQALKKLTQRCIIPYSSFPVAALLRTECGFFSGVNIEVRDWQKGLCAERVAIAKARAAGAVSFHEIHVYAPQSDYVSPCGACRQVLNEHMGDASMFLYHSESETTRLAVADLLPYQFTAGRLGKRT